MSVPAELAARVRAWQAEDPDPATHDELTALLEAGDGDELARRFAGTLHFGTAGMRGPLGAGPMRMNRVVVRRAAAGVARHLLATASQAAERGVVIGYDARHHSDVFALDTARVLAGAGVRALLLPRPLPTPVTAFAITHLGAAGGIMVTASHNPPGDNGYKVYLGDGAQIAPPHDSQIAAHIDAVGPLADLPLAPPDDPLITYMANEPLEAYLAHVPAVRRAPQANDVTVAHTSLHGVGHDVVMAAFARAGLPAPQVVAAQAEPDGAFPTVAFPNPEEPGAMDLVEALAREVGADIALANDPDADRLGASVPTLGGAWRRLTGDQIGWLLADHILRHTEGDERLVVTTLVSSNLLEKMAAAEGVHYAETYTGFKWIARAVLERPDRRLVFAYEQALGYLVTDVPLDKDGITAAVVLAEVAALARAEGTSVAERLADIETRFGRHVVAARSVRLDAAGVPRVLAALRARPPATIAGLPVTGVEDHAEANLLRFTCGSGARVQVRPSGTEPKVKVYVEVIDADPEPLADDMAAAVAAAASG